MVTVQSLMEEKYSRVIFMRVNSRMTRNKEMANTLMQMGTSIQVNSRMIKNMAKVFFHGLTGTNI